MTVPLSSDWPRACLALGTAEGERWTPFGSGILIVKKPVVWLVTLERALPPKDAPVSAWVSPANSGTLFDLSDLHQQTGLSWIRGNGWAATLCPVKPEWGTKAFNPEQTSPHDVLPVMAPCATVQYLYAAEEPFASGPTEPYVLPGVVSATGPTSVVTTVPVHPRNLGAPAFAILSGEKEPEVRLLGLIEAASPSAPGIAPLTSVKPIAQALALLEGEEAQAQQKRVLTGA